MRWPRRPWRRRRNLPFGGLGLTSPFIEGPHVQALQVRLNERGFAVEASGVYDEATAEAVRIAKQSLGVAYAERDGADRAAPELLGKLGL